MPVANGEKMPQIPLKTTQANIETSAHLEAIVDRLNEA
jgi:hypothetical protein